LQELAAGEHQPARTACLLQDVSGHAPSPGGCTWLAASSNAAIQMSRASLPKLSITSGKASSANTAKTRLLFCGAGWQLPRHAGQMMLTVGSVGLCDHLQKTRREELSPGFNSTKD